MKYAEKNTINHQLLNYQKKKKRFKEVRSNIVGFIANHHLFEHHLNVSSKFSFLRCF